MSLEDMVKTYVITSAQRGAKVHRDFLDSLNTYCDVNDATLIVLPINGVKQDEKLHPDLAEYKIATTDVKLNESIHIRNMKIPAQMMNPLTGLNRLIKYNQSAILPSPKQQFKVLPNSNSKLPKILTSTGAVTEPNYNVENRAGEIAEIDHVYGAVVVEVLNSKYFNLRHLRTNTTGSFHDLGTEYAGNKHKKSYADALVLGDLHVGSLDPAALSATYDQISLLRPQRLVIHDLFDAYSISHHHEGKPLYKALNWLKRDLHKEIEMCGNQLKEFKKRLPKGADIVIVKSNHDEHLNRYLEEGRFINDDRNLRLSAYLAQAYLDGKDPLKSAIDYVCGKIDRVKFLSRNDDYKVRGWQLGSHGDLGSNGSRGSSVQLEQSTGNSISGHTHTPEILRNVYKVGTLTKLKLDYNGGPSSWLHTNAPVYPDGSVQLLNIIDGVWRK
jgi:hypothetical protein